MKKILIVDDKKVLRDTIVDYLRDNYEVLEAEHGEKGLQIFKKENLDLVILDENLPGIDGLKTLELMKKIDKNVPVIALTGQLTVDMREKFIEAGVFDIQTKSAIYEKLLGSVEKALKGEKEISDTEEEVDYEADAERLKNDGRWEESALYLKEAGFENKILGNYEKAIELYKKSEERYKRAGRNSKAKDLEAAIKEIEKMQ